MIQDLQNAVLSGRPITRDEAAILEEAPLDLLCAAADEIRKRFCGIGFDLCSIVNGKSGRCSEDCKFCAQSSRYAACAEVYPLLDVDTIVRAAAQNAKAGALRFSIVTSGRRPSKSEVEALCERVRAVRKEVGIAVCVSIGLADEADFRALYTAGASRAHCNLEASAAFFPKICSTHTFADKLAAIDAARRAGLTVCSGGIIGLGETFTDRLDMAFDLRDLQVKSVPINFLNPIPGTPFAHNAPLSYEEKQRTVAAFRFILPDADIRLAGGRKLLPDRGAACFRAGANAAITGDMLTTAGVCAETDHALLKRLGFEVRHG